jgi:hypothetical protein
MVVVGCTALAPAMASATTTSATGSITTVSGSHLVDGETFTINDGFNAPTAFEFDSNASVTGGRVGVAFVPTDTGDQIKAKIVTAVNAVDTGLLVTASNAGTGLVGLVNDTAGSAGNHAITETVADVGFMVTGMSGGDTSPSFSSIGDRTGEEGEKLQIPLRASDIDGDPLVYSASNLPPGANFDPTTARFSWTPTVGQAGSYPNVHFQVSDGTLGESQDITITVDPANDWTFVQIQRVNSLTLQSTTDTFATQNAFGSAFAGPGQTQMNDALAAGVGDGSMSWLFEMPGLQDLSGISSPSFDLGVVGGTPVAPSGGTTYDGMSDLDWWYAPDPSDVEPDGSATHQLYTTLVARTLTAGPGSVALSLNLGGSPARLAMSMTRIQATTSSNSSAPLKSTGGSPPGHEPGENLPDSLTTFESMSSGKLAGRISARSLYNTPIPSSLTGSNCGNFYIASNTMLDLLVSGCKALGGIVTVVNKTQPDTVVAGVGSGTYIFTVDANHNVTGCTHNGGAATLSDCLDGAAYSTYFHFTTDRVVDREQVVVGKLLTVGTVGSGSVTSSPAGIDCGADCMEGYGPGTQVTLTAHPAAGFVFAAWNGCDNPSGATCGMTMGADKQVTATFNLDTTGGGGGGSGDGGGAAGSGGGTTQPDGGATQPTGGTTEAVADTTPPAFASASISPRKLRKRATVKFTLSEAAQVSYVFESVAPGRRVGSRCVKPTRANAKKKRCNRFVAVGRLSAPGVAGANAKTFTSRIGKRTLKRGTYRLTLRAADAAGNQSLPRRLTFVVV